MTQWETIQDSSAYISQVRLVPPKNYSVERGNGIFDAVSKTSIPIIKKPNLSKKNNKKSNPMLKSFKMKYMLWFIIALFAVSFYWQCSKPQNKSNGVCLRAHNTIHMQHAWLKDTQNSIQQSCSRVTQPWISRWNNNHWMDTTKAYAIETLNYNYIDTAKTYTMEGATLLQHTSRQLVHNYIMPYYTSTATRLQHTSTQGARLLQHTSTQLVHNYIMPFCTSTAKTITTYITQLKQQLDDYIKQGSNEELNKEEGDTMVEEKIKKTAKRILDYMNQLNSEKTGMKGDEAKRKAQEIIKMITKESNSLTREQVEFLVMDTKQNGNSLDIEIQSIMDVAAKERIQLRQKLELLQSHLTIETGHNTDLLITALKLEVEQLRADAEYSVRRKTKQVLDTFSDTMTVQTKDGIQQAQKNALKDLRKVYRDIYQTNQMIDNLVVSSS